MVWSFHWIPKIWCSLCYKGELVWLIPEVLRNLKYSTALFLLLYSTELLTLEGCLLSNTVSCHQHQWEGKTFSLSTGRECCTHPQWGGGHLRFGRWSRCRWQKQQTALRGGLLLYWVTGTAREVALVRVAGEHHLVGATVLAESCEHGRHAPDRRRLPVILWIRLGHAVTDVFWVRCRLDLDSFTSLRWAVTVAIPVAFGFEIQKQ